MKVPAFFLKTLFILTISVVAKGQNFVFTVAGTGNSTPYGDSILATQANLSQTEGLCLDAVGNLYVSDMGHGIVRKINAVTGIITTIGKSMGGPYGICADASGNIFVAGMGDSRIHRIDATTGIMTTVAGGGSSLGDGGPATSAQISDPQSVYVDGMGNLYISSNGRIRKVDAATGIINTIAGIGPTSNSSLGDGGPATSAEINSNAAGIVMDSAANIYIADRGNGRIRKIDAITSIITTVAGTIPGYSGDGSLAVNAKMNGPISLVIDCQGNMIIGDNLNDVIRKVDATTGIITTIAGHGNSTADGAAALDTKLHPEFLCLDKQSGNLYFSNWNGNQVRKITNVSQCSNADTSRGTGTTDTSTTGTGTTDTLTAIKPLNMHSYVSIYPNPVSDFLTVDASTNAFDSYRIINCLGQVVIQNNLSAALTKINVASLPSGIYYIVLRAEGKVVQRKFLKM